MHLAAGLPSFFCTMKSLILGMLFFLSVRDRLDNCSKDFKPNEFNYSDSQLLGARSQV